MTVVAPDQAAMAGMIAAARVAAADGALNDFIPALASVPREKFALALADASGEVASFGVYGEPFSIQSINKLFALIVLMQRSGDEIWRRLGA